MLAAFFQSAGGQILQVQLAGAGGGGLDGGPRLEAEEFGSGKLGGQFKQQAGFAAAEIEHRAGRGEEIAERVQHVPAL